jgi:hypothetical protein
MKLPIPKTAIFAITAFATLLVLGDAADRASAAPQHASTATPRPTATRRPTATPIGTKTAPKPTAVRTAGAVVVLNAEASFTQAQKDPCALVALADLAKLLGEKVAAGAPFDVANGRGCEYKTKAGLVSVSVARDDKGRALTRALASHVISGCTRGKVPTEADLAPFLKKSLAEKWRTLTAEDNKCSGKYAPVTEFGPDAFADRGRLGVVVGKHMLSAEVPGSTEIAVALAKQAFVR